ncbi:MAG: dihydrodipicolinate synthase family protein [candidate division KSB1 bacterium]|nr:dihydrodipicolinate synthase family protein [candidate division KSB1 bacterium]
MNTLRGVFVAATTPFVEDRVAPRSLAENVAKWEALGVSGYLIAGSTGEAVFLDDEEALDLVRAARGAIAQGRPMIVGIGRESVLATLRWGERVAAAGADYALCVTPHYFRAAMSPKALATYYSKVAEALPIPVILYSIPQCTGVHLSPETIAELAGHPNIVGLKDSSGDLAQLARIVRSVPRDFSVLIGHGDLLVAGLLAGAHGAVLAIANVVPELCVRIFRLCQEGKWDEAAAEQRRLSELVEKIDLAYGVAGIKAGMAIRGFAGGAPRLPLTPLEKPDVEGIAHLLRSLGL